MARYGRPFNLWKPLVSKSDLRLLSLLNGGSQLPFRHPILAPATAPASNPSEAVVNFSDTINAAPTVEPQFPKEKLETTDYDSPRNNEPQVVLGNRPLRERLMEITLNWFPLGYIVCFLCSLEHQSISFLAYCSSLN